MHLNSIQLLTPDLEETRAFYQKTLGLPVSDYDSHGVMVQIGTSQLIFEAADERVRPTTYHFAFNIPENQFEAAMAWVGERVTFLTDAEGNRQFDFANWDAHACYFADPAGNIVELIARHGLKNASNAAFTSDSLLNISEIGYPTEDVAATANGFCEYIGVHVFRGSQSAEFTAIGDDDGLLIIVRRGRLWYPDMRVQATHGPLIVKGDMAGKGFLLELK